MKNVLIFGLGKQGKKHMNFFQSQGWNITCVWKNKHKEPILSYDAILLRDRTYFLSFDCIIVAVSPIVEQEKIIRFLTDLSLSVNILIEKPITYDKNLLEELVKNKYIYFFIDEVALHWLLRWKELPNIIPVFSKQDPDIIEHISGFFLTRSDFSELLLSYQFQFQPFSKDDILYYHFSFDLYTIYCYKGYFFLDAFCIEKNIFHKALIFYSNMMFSEDSEPLNFKIKNNFFQLRIFLEKEGLYTPMISYEI